MTRLTRIRPSNLVIFAALPFIIYLFSSVPNYRRSFISIIGIEQGALALLAGAVLLTLLFVSGTVLPYLTFRDRLTSKRHRSIALAALGVNILLAFYLAAIADISSLIGSIIANLVDPTKSEMVIRAMTPRRLTPEAFSYVSNIFSYFAWGYAVFTLALSLIVLIDFRTQRLVIARYARIIIFVVNGGALLFLLLAAHLGFASGLFTTIRAGIFAYLLAAVLGLIWASLLRLTLKRRTIMAYGIVSAMMLCGSFFAFLQPKTTYILAGSLEKSVAIIKGTPKSLVDDIRYGQFDASISQEIGLRSASNPEHALKLLNDGKEVSAVFLPIASIPTSMPEIWRTEFLPDEYETPAIALLVGGLLIGLLTISGFQHNRHPLSVTAEFFIDTVRGVPMLVIILFIGLPLSGSLKDFTDGAIDLPNVLRGVIAIAIGYSAYLAEIFRAGIEAVPRSQIEAARSLGLSTWQLARFIVLPQALRIVIPPLGNEFIAILKDTSLLSILSVRDMTQRMREFQSASFLPFAPFNSAAILYVCLTLAAASLISFIERKYDVKSR
jgi:polar amino acid transport system permease protein